jgi:hypothetical protein
MSAPEKRGEVPWWLIVLAFVVMPIGIVINAWGYATLWAWFVVPLGAPTLGWAHASGLSLLIGFATHKPTPDEPNPDRAKNLATAIGRALFAAPLTVGIGWCVHWVMVQP